MTKLQQKISQMGEHAVRKLLKQAYRIPRSLSGLVHR